jgi:hypothetical protein
VLVDRDIYLLEVCRYVELNPVRAGLATEPADWPWNSYATLTGQAPCPPWLDRAAVWGYLLGDEAFVLRMQALASDRAVSDKEIPKAHRASTKTLQDWLNTMPSQDDAIVAAHRHSQLSLSDIARALGLSVSRVSRIVAKQSEASAHPEGADR